MKLGDFLQSSSVPDPTRLVRFRVRGILPSGESKIADAEALLRFVSDHECQEAHRDAAREMRAMFGDDTPPPDRLAEEALLQILLRALRRTDDARAPFASTALELRRALVPRVGSVLMRQYSAFIADEFPDVVTDEEMKVLVEDAKKKSLFDLFSERGYSQTATALRSFATAAGMPLSG